MEDLSLLSNMALVLGIAFVGGVIAYVLRLPMIIGYLTSGIIIGPHAIGLIKDIDDVETLATIGVVLLMFTLGMEFSLKTLKQIGAVGIFGGIVQVITSALLGFAIASLIGSSFRESVLFGFFISLSSTTIVLKLLMDRGELSTPHGRIMIGILLLQDLSVVPMIAFIPHLGDTGMMLFLHMLWALLKAGIFLGTTFIVGLWIFPWFVKTVTGRRSRELFLLSIVCICFGAGFAADQFGLSIALGAFLAGLMISESEYVHQAIADLRPLRDTFAVLFFAALGMLADPEFILNNPKEVAIVVLLIICGKFIISALIPRFFGYSAKTNFFVGIGLFQIGEFSFILAAMALEEGLISEDIYDLTMAAAFITILLTPFTFGAASQIHYRIMMSKRVMAIFGDRPDPVALETGSRIANHVVICGYGRVAKRLLDELEYRKLPYLIVDIDPIVIYMARKKGIPCIYGDASNPEVLAATNLRSAKVLIIAIPDPVAAKIAVQNARAINRMIDIVARVHWKEDVDVLRKLGVSEIVRPEIEAGLEIIRHTLYRLDIEVEEINLVINRLREKEVLRKKDDITDI